MKKTLRRALAMLVAVCLVFSVTPIISFADESTADERLCATSSTDSEASEKDRSIKQERQDSQQAFIPTVAPMTDSGSSSGVTRYTVLILDVSGSMDGTPMDVQKEAAKKFCNSVTTAAGTNYVAIVEMYGGASVVAPFTTNEEELSSCIDDLYASGGTNISASLERASDLLNSAPSSESGGIIKNVVLCSDGLPESGDKLYQGRYTNEEGDYYYPYANAAYEKSVSLKSSGANLYTLGFFHSLSGKELRFGQQLMSDLASSAGQYYEVTKAEDLEFTFGDITDDVITDNFKNTGSFSYASGDTRDYTSTFYYDDNYFADRSSLDPNSSLATMSMCLALSAFGSNKTSDYASKSCNLSALLDSCGYPKDNFETNQGFKEKPGADTIGVGASYKTIKEEDGPCTLIAVAIRGAGYESEWASNLTIGTSGAHQGFGKARDDVLSFLNDYVSSHGISGKVKLWITGYSRAAATANLVAGALDDGYKLGGTVGFDNSNVFAYCFEAPKGALASEASGSKYNNIFSIINPNDFVTKVAPTEPKKTFGFARYGVSLMLPSKLSDSNYTNKHDNMLDKLKQLDSASEYIVDDFQMKKISVPNLVWDVDGFFKEGLVVEDTDEQWDQNAFLDGMLTKLFAERVRDRSNYVENYQSDIREIAKIVYGSGDKVDDFTDIFLNKIDKHSGLLAAYFVFDKTSYALDLIAEDVADSLEEAGITGYTSGQVKSVAIKAAALLVPFGVSHPNYTITAFSNWDRIKSAHFPELCFSWLQSFDGNYTSGGESQFSVGGYRVVHINCPVDVEVTDRQGTRVALIEDDVVVPQDGSSIVAFVNENGEKLVYLPADQEYTVGLIATDDGEMTYSVTEFSDLLGGTSRIRNYYDVDLVKGSSFEGSIPVVSEGEASSGLVDGATADYQLKTDDGTILQANEDIKGIDAAESVYLVSVSSNDDNLGVANGDDAITKGGYALVTATPLGSSTFKGWYDGDTLVSTDKEYRFRVTEDIDLVAQFDSHTYGEPSFNWSGDECTVTFTPTDGSDGVVNIPCNVTKTQTDPSCQQEGVITRKASVTFNGRQYENEVYEKIPALGHDLILNEAVAATEEADGHIRYYSCTRCDTWFSDASATKEIVDKSSVITKFSSNKDSVSNKAAASKGATIAATGDSANAAIVACLSLMLLASVLLMLRALTRRME